MILFLSQELDTVKKSTNTDGFASADLNSNTPGRNSGTPYWTVIELVYLEMTLHFLFSMFNWMPSILV